MNYKQLTGKSIRDGFIEFNKNNPHIYKSFEKQALNAIARGREKISAKLIINWIRWNEFLESTDKNFKINDAYQSYYAREFVKNNPDNAGVFEFRKLRNEEKGPYMEVGKDGELDFI
ncbi:MAG: hypothetical protein EKK63_01730 [Acinetobacter sp.]|uniref:hypothetical protein n=1 Tax=Acinetobacter sp. TaxID=472 RepID=UPI000F9ED117|nr:hypothetical protein [Acinetobacter sp.]RUP42325.1 MAG: hypothetical protein EKK63_01730 [Acinetobacter sp.]